MSQINPREHDEAEAELFGQLRKAQERLADLIDQVHRAARDKKVDRWTRHERWAMSTEEALASSTTGLRASYAALTEEIYALRQGIDQAEAIWRAHRWSRFILCLSSNGHIHNFAGCHTLRPTSLLQWHPEFSGLTEEEAVNGVGSRDGLGPILCTHCFPSAPVEFKRDPAEVSRERNA
jgi:hypothetical protein